MTGILLAFRHVRVATGGLIAALLDLGILHEMTGRKWGRSFQAHEVLAALERKPEPS